MSQDFAATMPLRVLVTGATGLLGGNVVRELLDRGVEVVGLVRDPAKAAALLPSSPGLRLVTGDVTDASTVGQALAGVDGVVHTAAYFREYYQPNPDVAALQRTNVAAVRGLLRAAADAGAGVVVHTSSSATLGPGSAGEPADEETRPDLRALRNEYAASKLRAEQVVADAVAETGLRVPLVLPGWMWGPGDAGPTSSGRLFLAVARGAMPAVPRAGSQVVDARDVAAACLLALTRGVSARRYAVAGTWRSLDEVAAAIARTTGARQPREVPSRAFLLAAGVLEAHARLRRRPPVASRAGVRLLLEGSQRHVSSARAVSELGVTFRPLDATVQDEARWFRDRGLLPAAAHHDPDPDPAGGSRPYDRTDAAVSLGEHGRERG